jgi:hypothetical protein
LNTESTVNTEEKPSPEASEISMTLDETFLLLAFP